MPLDSSRRKGILSKYLKFCTRLSFFSCFPSLALYLFLNHHLLHVLPVLLASSSFLTAPPQATILQLPTSAASHRLPLPSSTNCSQSYGPTSTILLLTHCYYTFPSHEINNPMIRNERKDGLIYIVDLSPEI